MALDPYLSLKLRRFSMLTMVTVVYVHAFNFPDSYLYAARLFTEPFNFPNFLQVLITNGLFRFGIPLFFMRSGFLMAETANQYSYAGRIKKRTITLLAPYMIWSLLGLAITWLFELHAVGNTMVESTWLRRFDNLPVHDLSVSQFFEVWIADPISFQLWFLRSLFLYTLLFPGLVWLTDRYARFFLPFLGIAWLLSIEFPLLEAEGLLSFTLGVWLQRHARHKVTDSAWIDKFRLFWWLPVFILLKTWLAFHPTDWMNPVVYFMHKIMQPFLLMAVWRLYDLVADGKTRTYLADGWNRYNFFVYGFHVPVLYFATAGCFMVLDRSPLNSIVVFLLLPLVIIALSIGFGALVRVVSKPVFKIMTGGRG